MYDQSSEPFLSGFLHLFFFFNFFKADNKFCPRRCRLFETTVKNTRQCSETTFTRDSPEGGGEGALIYFTNKVNNLQTKLLYNFLGS